MRDDTAAVSASNPASDALMQVPTHALYHNAQISFMMRSMGHQLPDSSWILWGRERIAKGTA